MGARAHLSSSSTSGKGGCGVGGVDKTASNLVHTSGIARLIEDLQRLMEERESADVLFLVGREETPIYAHRIILQARCKNFPMKRNAGGSLPTVNKPTPYRKVHFSADTFRNFLIYVYTGKIAVHDTTVFEMMTIAQELGADELRLFCEEHIASNLNVNNACTYLAAAKELHERSANGQGTKSFLDRCIAYIGENAIECIQTISFLNLSKEALIKLISSDYLALEEELVWRAVLEWAKHQAGVKHPTSCWTEEERQRVCKFLDEPINYVRLLLIDSQVFAEEVEPTGAVPMELSLERYRHAALGHRYRENPEDKRLQPRVTLNLFMGSNILSQDKMCYQRVLNNWFGTSKQVWRLVYRASTHGYSAEAFHRHCDGISPTYTVIMGPRGEICGGFSDVPWGKTSNKGHYSPSEKAFLFTLVNNSEQPPTKFDITKKMFAICNHPGCGPIFGAGADLLISGNCNSNDDSYSNLPHSYDGENASSNILMGDYNFAVADYEVFTPAPVNR